MHDRPIIALDFPTQKKWLFLEKFPKEEALFVKVGMELYAEGPAIVRWLKARTRCFLGFKIT